MKQQSFASAAWETKRKKTRREMFLEEMEQVVPWGKLVKLFEPYYPKGETGRPPLGLERMLRIHFMQLWFNQSDPGMEDLIYESESVRRFAGVELGIDAVPDESTILRFRHTLERHGLAEQLFDRVGRHLEQRGLLLRSGSIVDATLIAAPPSTKNKSHQRDPEMSQTKKGNQWYFGMKMHIGTDRRGIVHTAVATTAAVHDSQVMDDCLHGEEQAIYGDKAYAGEEPRQRYTRQGVRWRVAKKGRRGQALSERERAFNRRHNAVRARVEHVFHVVKRLWGHAKVRYRGLEKNASRYFTLFALANLYLLRRRLLPQE
ncbi:MAG TPA: IS5 family transposase [Gammaproteobacteria bacterium]|nr:IS5 family transposase [Gammaproteobacteria bacterium]